MLSSLLSSLSLYIVYALEEMILFKGKCTCNSSIFIYPLRRLIVQNFWSSEIRLPEGTLDRTVAMLEAMYSPGSEQHYLSYSTNLLLEMTSKSPDYQRQIFEHPLSECTFRVSLLFTLVLVIDF